MEILKFSKRLSAVQIIDCLRNKAFDPDHFGSVDNYLEFLASSLWRFQGIGISVTGDTVEIKCNSVISQMINNGIIELCDGGDVL